MSTFLFSTRHNSLMFFTLPFVPLYRLLLYNLLYLATLSYFSYPSCRSVFLPTYLHLPVISSLGSYKCIPFLSLVPFPPTVMFIMIILSIYILFLVLVYLPLQFYYLTSSFPPFSSILYLHPLQFPDLVCPIMPSYFSLSILYLFFSFSLHVVAFVLLYLTHLIP